MTKHSILEVLKAIGELSSDGIFLLTMPARVLEYVNDSLLKIFDISHRSFATEPAFFVNHIAEEDKGYLEAEINRLLLTQKVEDVEFNLKSHDQSVKTVSCNAYFIEKGKYIIGFVKDITGSKEHENYIIDYGAKKNSLLDMITHNLSGPLNVSKNLIDSLSKVAAGHEVTKIEDHINLISQNTQHCIELVNEFLEEEHLVSESISVKVNRFELIEKLNTILERIRKSYPDYRFEVQTNKQEILINTDDVKLLQVANNLISNAIKWSASGSVVEIVIADEGEAASITVRDYGIGIPDHLKGLIFKRNTPASRPGLQGEKSIGMGLYIVKKLVKLMKGELTFESTENEGSAFTVRLPKEAETTTVNDNSLRYNRGGAS